MQITHLDDLNKENDGKLMALCFALASKWLTLLLGADPQKKKAAFEICCHLDAWLLHDEDKLNI